MGHQVDVYGTDPIVYVGYIAMDNSKADLVFLIKRAFDLKGLTLALAESCTGGLIGGAITEIPGSSSFFLGTAGTYSNQAKISVLSVPESVIDRHGAVSRECAEAMAKGALELFGADMALSVTGIAGPDGGSDEKPVGLVWFGLAVKDVEVKAFHHLFSGGRKDVRDGTVKKALMSIFQEISESGG